MEAPPLSRGGRLSKWQAAAGPARVVALDVEYLQGNVPRQPANGWLDANVGCMPGCFGTSRVLFAPKENGAPTDPLAAHRDAVSSKKADVATRYRSVNENRLIVECLKRSIGLGRALDKNEYDLILGAVRDPKIDTAFIRQFTTISPFDMKKAMAKLEKAKAELEKAKAELEKAKAELKEAEAEVEKASEFGQGGDLDDVLAQSSVLELKPLAFDVARDIEGFSTFIVGVARTIYKSDGINCRMP